MTLEGFFASACMVVVVVAFYVLRELYGYLILMLWGALLMLFKQYTKIEIDGHVTCDCCLMPMPPRDQKLEWYSYQGKWYAVVYWHCPVCNTQQWDHFPSHCCQTCGEAIGWVGRFHQWNGLNWLFKIHRCNPNAPRPR